MCINSRFVEPRNIDAHKSRSSTKPFSLPQKSCQFRVLIDGETYSLLLLKPDLLGQSFLASWHVQCAHSCLKEAVPRYFPTPLVFVDEKGLELLVTAQRQLLSSHGGLK